MGRCIRFDIRWSQDPSWPIKSPRHQQLRKANARGCKTEVQGQGEEVHPVNGMPHRCVLWRQWLCWCGCEITSVSITVAIYISAPGIHVQVSLEELQCVFSPLFLRCCIFLSAHVLQSSQHSHPWL